MAFEFKHNQKDSSKEIKSPASKKSSDATVGIDIRSLLGKKSEKFSAKELAEF